METIPSYLKPSNIANFGKYVNDINKKNMREQLFLFVLKGREEDYFDLDSFCKLAKCNMTSAQCIANEILPEFEKLGWKYRFSYGNTGVFIYSTPNPPKTCYDSMEY